MAVAREVQALLSNRQTLSFLDRVVKRQIDRILAQLAAGISRPGAARANELLREIDKLSTALDPKRPSFMRNWIKKNITRAGILGDKQATRELAATLKSLSPGTRSEFGTGLNRSFTATNTTALKGMAAAMTEQMGRAAADLRATVGTLVRKTQQTLISEPKLREITAGGILRGATGKQVADDLASALLGKKISPATKKRLAEVGFRGDMFKEFEAVARNQVIRVGKRRMTVRSYTDLVARTQMREANRTMTVVRLQQNDVNHVKISRHPQLVRDECTPFAGQVFYIGREAKDPMGFPKLSSTPNGGPPFHPNCIHVITPFPVAFHTGKSIGKAREGSRKIPRGLFGKGSTEVREAVAKLTDAELKEIAPQGFEDLNQGAA